MQTTLVYFTISELQMTHARHALAENGIESFVIDKKDTVYAGILGGRMELYVRQADHDKAHAILKEAGMLEDIEE